MKKTTTKCLLLVTAILSIGITVRGQTQSKINVQGGSVVSPGTYPWIVSLKGNGKDICGGSLIAPQWVLTAGHCGLGFGTIMPKPDQVYVDLNVRSNPTGNAELIPVSQIFVYPGFSLFGGGVDLALLKLAQPSSKPTVAIARKNTTDTLFYQPNSACKVLGWGETGSGQSDTLRMADIVVIDFTTCKNNYQQANQQITDDVVCAGYVSPSPAAGGGAGDSGGPLFVKDGNGAWKQIGVVSGGKSNITEEKYPGLYTKVLKFSGWIDSVITANSTNGWQESYSLQHSIFITNSFAQLKIKTTTSLSAASKLAIYDASGKCLLIQPFEVAIGEQDIDIGALMNGLYLIQITNGAKVLFQGKFAKISE